jgi:hypothetical protein
MVGSRRFGGTAELVRAADDDVQFVAGVRVWF